MNIEQWLSQGQTIPLEEWAGLMKPGYDASPNKGRTIRSIRARLELALTRDQVDAVDAMITGVHP